MTVLQGAGTSPGIAFGTFAFWTSQEHEVKRVHVQEPSAELCRLDAAVADCQSQLESLYQKALDEIGANDAQIFEIHKMMLEDDDYLESIRNIIQNQQVNAEYAVAATGDNFAKMFSEMDDEYMQGRVADVKDISDRLVRCLTGNGEQKTRFEQPTILAAADLSPSETIQLDKRNVLAIVTEGGSANSHTVILARTLDIPAVVDLGADTLLQYDGRSAAVDGSTGTVYIEPDAGTLATLQEKAAAENEKKRLLRQLTGKENRTLDGASIDVFANIGSIADVALAQQNDAGGIGLFRSEFLYLGRTDYPTEEEQFASYKLVVENMGGKKVVIRTLDIGADKQIDYFGLPREENPAMGYRAIRICLDRPEVFKTQLRALYRASAFGHLAIMFPMITSEDEVDRVMEIVDEVKVELRGEGIPFDENVELGIMIETPAAALVSDDLARKVDFFSIGTNDLTQYTLAVDRQNENLSQYYQPHHKGLLRLIQRTVNNAHNAGIWVGICGELAADLELTGFFLGIGVDELSVSPSSVLPLRERIRSINKAQELPHWQQKLQ